MRRSELLQGIREMKFGYVYETKFRGQSRVAQGFQIAVAAYNLLRIPKLLRV